MPKLVRFESYVTARFITFCTHTRYRLFDDENVCAMAIHHIRRFRDDNYIKVLAYVVMPEHVHLLVVPPEKINLGAAVGRMKGLMAHEVIQYWRSNAITPPDALCTPVLSDRQHMIWMPGCSDHPIRGDTEIRETISYIHAKPVMRRLTDAPEDWRWSSYRWYMCCGDLILEMDAVAL